MGNKVRFNSFTSRGKKVYVGLRYKYTGPNPSNLYPKTDIVYVKSINGFPTPNPDQLTVTLVFGEARDERTYTLAEVNNSFWHDEGLELNVNPKEVELRTARKLPYQISADEILGGMDALAVGNVYQHYNGTLYKVVGLGYNESNLTDFMENYVSYRKMHQGQLVGPTFVRPLKTWFGTMENQITDRFALLNLYPEEADRVNKSGDLPNLRHMWYKINQWKK